MPDNFRHVTNMANSIVGVSILSMPYCFKEAGIVLGVLLILISGFITKKTSMFLIRSAIMARRRSLEFLAFHVFGIAGKLSVELTMILFLFGICISFHVVIGDLAPAIVARVMTIENTWSLRVTILVGIVFFIILPLCLLRNIDSLASMSAASLGFYLFLICVIFYSALPRLIDGSWWNTVELWNFKKSFQVLPIMMLALACQSNVFEIYDSLPDPGIVEMRSVVCQAVNLCCAFYIGVGFLGYVAFADKDFGGNIIVSLPESNLTEVIKLFFVVSLAISFPLMLFPCRTSIHSLIYRRNTQASYEIVGNYMPEVRFKGITITVLVVSLIVGIIMSNIAFVLGLLGSTMGMLISLILPCVFFIKVNSKASGERLFAQGIMLFGLVLMVLGTYIHLVEVEHNEIKLEDTAPILNANNPVPQLPVVLPDVKLENPAPIEQVEQVEVRKEPVIPEPPQELPKEVAVEPKILKQDVLAVADTNADAIANAKPPDVVAPESKSVDTMKKESSVSDTKLDSLHPDAIKKEEKEHAEEQPKAVAPDNEKSQVEILQELEKQQVKILEEQKKILQELKEQKEQGDETRLKEQSEIAGVLVDGQQEKIGDIVQDKISEMKFDSSKDSVLQKEKIAEPVKDNVEVPKDTVAQPVEIKEMNKNEAIQNLHDQNVNKVVENVNPAIVDASRRVVRQHDEDVIALVDMRGDKIGSNDKLKYNVNPQIPKTQNDQIKMQQKPLSDQLKLPIAESLKLSEQIVAHNKLIQQELKKEPIVPAEKPAPKAQEIVPKETVIEKLKIEKPASIKEQVNPLRHEEERKKREVEEKKISQSDVKKNNLARPENINTESRERRDLDHININHINVDQVKANADTVNDVKIIEPKRLLVPDVVKDIKVMGEVDQPKVLDVQYDTRHLLWISRRRKKRTRGGMGDQEYWDET